MYKVRFNLGKGKNYMTWKLTNLETKEYIYVNPKDVSLILSSCTLKNRKNSAMKINSGGHKRVCAWILCDNLEIVEPKENVKGRGISYNPRIQPNWVCEGKDVDNKSFDKIITTNNKLFNVSLTE